MAERGCSLPIVLTPLRAIAAVLAVTLVSIGCGTGNDADSTAPTPTPAPATAADDTTGDPAASAAPTAPAPADAPAAETPSAEPAAAPAPPQATPDPTHAPSTPAATAAPTTTAATPTAAPPTAAPATPTAAAEPPTGSTVLAVLNSLTAEPEYGGLGYERGDFDHDRAYLCDNAGADPYTGVAFDPETCDVDHIVAAQEAFESGAWEWDAARRRAFGNDAANLVPTRDCVNRSKGARDMAEWAGRIGSGDCEGLTTTAQGECYLAWKAVEVKAAHSLSVDQAERDALQRTLRDCPPSGPMAPSAPSVFQPATEPAPTAAPASDSPDCHPSYEPCLPNLAGDALNCGDLTADQRPVRVLVPGVDPYRLDRDGDGWGCTS